MPAASVAVLYWTASTIMWGKVVADTDAEIQAVVDFYVNNPRVSTLTLPADKPHDDDTCRAAIAQTTGKPIPSDICAVIGDTNAVVAVIRADPSENSPPQGQLYALCPANTMVGATYNPQLGSFINPIVVSPPRGSVVAPI